MEDFNPLALHHDDLLFCNISLTLSMETNVVISIAHKEQAKVTSLRRALFLRIAGSLRSKTHMSKIDNFANDQVEQRQAF